MYSVLLLYFLPNHSFKSFWCWYIDFDYMRQKLLHVAPFVIPLGGHGLPFVTKYLINDILRRFLVEEFCTASMSQRIKHLLLVEDTFTPETMADKPFLNRVCIKSPLKESPPPTKMEVNALGTR